MLASSFDISNGACFLLPVSGKQVAHSALSGSSTKYRPVLDSALILLDEAAPVS
jgi:hypothetical protein